jgi:hypothetical protein
MSYRIIISILIFLFSGQTGFAQQETSKRMGYAFITGYNWARNEATLSRLEEFGFVGIRSIHVGFGATVYRSWNKWQINTTLMNTVSTAGSNGILRASVTNFETMLGASYVLLDKTHHRLAPGMMLSTGVTRLHFEQNFVEVDGVLSIFQARGSSLSNRYINLPLVLDYDVIFGKGNSKWALGLQASYTLSLPFNRWQFQTNVNGQNGNLMIDDLPPYNWTGWGLRVRIGRVTYGQVQKEK